MRLKTLGIVEHNRRRAVEFHPEFLAEFQLFPKNVRSHAYAAIAVLAFFGPQLGRPRVDTLNGSKHSNMKELRFRAHDGAWRIAFAFDAKQKAILLVGGDKSGVSERKFYRSLIEIADRRFDQHRAALEKESKS
jgi:hypothetical protein